ncbi:MAG: caspase family protein [Paracoccaceae bacterium]
MSTVFLCVCLSSVTHSQDQIADPAPRVALVFGNSAYQNVTQLPNASNDAQLIAEKLWESGFEVIESLDADRETMLANLATFRSRLREGSEAVVYYAGHAVRIGSTNYLLPVSVSPASIDDLKVQSINAQLLINVMNDSGSRLNIILLDACRNNPFDNIDAAQTDRIASRSITIGQSRAAVLEGLAALSESGDGGLAEMSAGKTETLISFATAPGSVALDGIGRHSPYTQALADNIDEPGLEIGQLFRRVRGDVRESTGGHQITWTTSTLESNFYFKPLDARAAGATTGMATATDTLGALPPKRIIDRALWRAIKDSSRIDAFVAYLRTRPDGAFVDDANQRIVELGGDPSKIFAPKKSGLFPSITRGLKAVTPTAKKDATEALFRAEIAVPIGAGTGEIKLNNDTAGWVYVADPPRLGLLSGTSGNAINNGGVSWLEGGESLEYVPIVGSNGGIDKVTVQRLGNEGRTDNLDITIEAFIHACDMLAGEPQDSRRVTAGARQFTLNNNFDAAIVACELAVEDYPNVPRFWAQLARAYRAGEEYEKALKWQQKAVDADYLAAVVNLGQMYLDGQAVQQDYDRAHELFTYAADREEPASFTALGWIYRAGVGVEQDYREAMHWYARGAEKGNDWAMTNIAEIHQTGKGFPRDPQKAVEWYTRAAKSGELTAQTRLARMYQTGDGIPQDFEKAKFWYETAAGRGVPNAVTRLGIMYEEGHGQMPDIEAAFRLFTRAAAEGDNEALFRLGKLHASSTPLYDDPSRAAELLELAVKRNVYGSHRTLGKLYIAGRGVAKDANRAIELFEIAAEGNPWAARDAGKAYESIGNIEKAVEWLEHAASNGVNWAARDMARFYVAGRGVPKDRVESLIWYAKAVALDPDTGLRKLIDDAMPAYDQSLFAKAAQTLLNRRGVDVGPADGKLGPKTRTALDQVLTDQGQPLSKGELTIDTLSFLARQQ